MEKKIRLADEDKEKEKEIRLAEVEKRKRPD